MARATHRAITTAGERSTGDALDVTRSVPGAPAGRGLLNRAERLRYRSIAAPIAETNGFMK